MKRMLALMAIPLTSFLVVDTMEATAAPIRTELTKAKSVIAKQRIQIRNLKKVIRVRNATIAALRTQSPVCPIPNGMLESITAMSPEQAWTILPILYEKYEAEERRYDAYIEDNSGKVPRPNPRYTTYASISTDEYTARTNYDFHRSDDR